LAVGYGLRAIPLLNLNAGFYRIPTASIIRRAVSAVHLLHRKYVGGGGEGGEGEEEERSVTFPAKLSFNNLGWTKNMLIRANWWLTLDSSLPPESIIDPPPPFIAPRKPKIHSPLSETSLCPYICCVYWGCDVEWI